MFKFNLHPNEKLENIYRQSEVVLIKPVLIIFILIYVPWAFLIKYELDFQFRRLLLFWTFVVLAYGINKYLLWLLNCYLITSQRVVVIIYHQIFKKQVIESPIERILNISFQTKGFFSSLLRYGDVEVQIVGLVEPLVFKNVKNPERVKDILWNIHNKHVKKVSLGQATGFDEETISQIQQRIGYQGAISKTTEAKKRKIV